MQLQMRPKPAYPVLEDFDLLIFTWLTHFVTRVIVPLFGDYMVQTGAL